MEKIVFSNFLYIIFENMDDLEYIKEISDPIPIELPKSLILKFIRDNEKRLIKNHTLEEINTFVDSLGDNIKNETINIEASIEHLIKFLINLVKINEIGLAKKVFDIANQYKFVARSNYVTFFFNEYLVDYLASLETQENNTFSILLTFIIDYDIIHNSLGVVYVKRLLNKLMKMQKYKLLMTALDLFVLKDYKGTTEVINMILPGVKTYIDSKNNKALIKYLSILNLELDGKLKSSEDRLLKFNNIIKDIEQNKT